MQSYWAITKGLMQALLRDRQSLFFAMILPLVFLFIFGPMYSGQEERSIAVAVFAQGTDVDREMLTEALGKMPGLTVDFQDSLHEVTQNVAAQKADFGLGWDGSVLEVFLNPARIQDNSTFQQLSQGIRSDLDQARLGLQEFITVNVVDLAKEGQSVGQLAYMFPGIIAVGVMSSGLFLISSSFLHMKERAVLKRLTATPMGRVEFLGGLITTRLVLSVLSALLTLLVGRLFLGVSLPIHWVWFLVYLPLSTLIMAGAGALIAMIGKTSRSASQIASLLMTLMMFVSGVYFPVELLPTYFRAAGRVLPATYISRGFRFIMGVETMSRSAFLMETALLTLLGLAAIWAAAMKGSWDLE